MPISGACSSSHWWCVLQVTQLKPAVVVCHTTVLCCSYVFGIWNVCCTFVSKVTIESETFLCGPQRACMENRVLYAFVVVVKICAIKYRQGDSNNMRSKENKLTCMQWVDINSLCWYTVNILCFHLRKVMPHACDNEGTLLSELV